MVQRIAAVGMVTLVLACGALCQDARQSLPDAPSARAAIPASELSVIAEQVRSPFQQRRSSFKVDAFKLPEAMRPDAFADPEKKAPAQKLAHDFFAKHFSANSAKQKPSDHAAVSDGFVGRAAHAATGIFFTRDESGRGRVNTSYFLRAMASVAADTASRPYWRRSPGEPLSDFGSTVGNDAGMNLLHEFGPGLQRMVKSRAPKFVGRIIEGRIGHN